MDSGKLYGITYDPQAEVTAFYDTDISGISAIVYVTARADQSNDDSHHRGDHLLMFEDGLNYLTIEDIFFELGINNSFIKEDVLNVNRYLFWDYAYTIRRTSANNFSINGETLSNADDLFPVESSLHMSYPTGFLAYNTTTGEVFDPQIGVTNGNLVVNAPEASGTDKIILGVPQGQKILATMPIEAGAQFGTAQMGIKRIDELGVRFYKSYAFQISNNGTDWQTVRVANSLGQANTGREEIKFQGSWDYDNVVYIRSMIGEPLEITGINMRGVSNDG